MNNKNYTCTLCNGPEYTVSQKLYEDFINYRGHCITKIIRGLYAMVPSTLYHKIIHELYGAVSRTLYHKKCIWTLWGWFEDNVSQNYTWTLWSCFEDTVSQTLYKNFINYRGHYFVFGPCIFNNEDKNKPTKCTN